MDITPYIYEFKITTVQGRVITPVMFNKNITNEQNTVHRKTKDIQNNEVNNYENRIN